MVVTTQERFINTKEYLTEEASTLISVMLENSQMPVEDRKKSRLIEEMSLGEEKYVVTDGKDSKQDYLCSDRSIEGVDIIDKNTSSVLADVSEEIPMNEETYIQQ